MTIDYTTAYDLKKETGSLTQGDVHIGQALAHLTGTYDTANAATVLQMKLVGTGMPVADLEGVLPAAGVNLPSGASLKSGGMDVNLGISGPVDKLVITGPVNLSNGDLAGFNLKQKLGALSSFAGLGGNSGGGNDTQIQKLSANVRVDPSGTKADNVDLIVPSIGTVTGNAAVSAENKLSGKMMAKLAAGSVAGAMTGALSSFTGGGSSNGGGIPFTLSGTTSTPIFLPDLSGVARGLGKTGTGAAGGAAGAAGAAAGALGGLFGKKKK